MTTYTIAIRLHNQPSFIIDWVSADAFKPVYEKALQLAKKISSLKWNGFVNIYEGESDDFTAKIYAFHVDSQDDRFHNIEFARLGTKPFNEIVINDRVRR